MPHVKRESDVAQCYTSSGSVISCVFQNILMRDRQQIDYCVACQELACDVSKDDPGKLAFSPCQLHNVKAAP